MKKIEFGFANEDEPRGQWEGIGIREGLLLTDATYYGAIAHNGDLVGKFVVIDALVDVYADASCTLFLNQEQSLTAKRAEMFLNDERVREKIANIEDVIRVCDGVRRANNFFKLIELDEKIIATSIRPDVFTEKSDAMKHCHNTFSDSQRMLNSNNRAR